MRVRTACTIALGVCLLLLTGLLTGCSRQDPEPQKPTPPPVVTQKPTERIEMMPSDSEEFMRRHYIDATGVEVQTDIEYRNKDKAVIKYRGDQTQSEYQRTTKDGKVVIQRYFAADGKTVVRGQELRDDGTVKVKISQDASGAITTTTYWYDGQRVFSESVAQPNGAYKTTYFYKNGQKWLVRSGPNTGVIATEVQYSRTGQLQFKREKSGSETTVTLYRNDGTELVRQHLVETPSQWGSYTYKTMKSVDEMSADGKTVERTLVMSSDGWSVSQVVRYNSDGTRLVRDVRYDGTVTHEEKVDANGNVLSKKDYSSSDNESESIDRSNLREPYSQDPVQNWDYQERYPQYRNQD